MSDLIRPKVGDPMALFWVMGYLMAGEGRCANPFHRTDLNSSKIWQMGHDAKLLDKNIKVK